MIEKRSSGVLLHITSLPTDYGIGDLGPAAYEWIDRLAGAGLGWWQILPLGPVGKGNSPYSAMSAFAGDPLLISPELLVREGIIDRGDAMKLPATSRIDWRRVRAAKTALLERAWARHQARGRNRISQPLWAFESREKAWLEDYAAFMAGRDGSDPAMHRFWQFLFYRQLDQLRAYAKRKGVGIIGDLPIFVSPESADVAANPKLFQLDRRGRPTAVAGVPPDLFCCDGQRWGNPLYDWSAMKRDGYRWWIARVRQTLRQADLVRLDHFRGFESYWRIPAGASTARSGKWVKGPGLDLFAALRKAVGELPLIAEDLGIITPAVERLRDELGLPGMRILQFAFEGEADNPHLPHNHVERSVVYTGTHDNDTTAGWVKSLTKSQRDTVGDYLGERPGVWPLIRQAWASVARLAIVPAQDLLALGSNARMNTPGTTEGNWSWRMRDIAAIEKPLQRLGEWSATFGR
jgi:4-alpha-glucanotransferase